MKLTLNSLFNYIEDDGIFSYLNTYSVPWKNTVDVDILNLDYHTKMGSRVISKTVIPLVDEDGLSTAHKQKLAKLIYNKNKVKWDELWSSLSLYDRFDPLNNTDWSETERFEHRGTDSKTQNLGAKTNSYTKGQQANTSQTGAQTFTEGSHTDTIGSQSNTTGTHTDTHEEKKSAYNSSSYQPNDKTEDVYGQISETLGQRQDSYGSKENSQSARSDSFTEGQRIDSSTEGAQQNTESGSNSYTDIHTIERAGNIGVTTSGQLIDDFRRVVDWQFFDHVYDDINEILVLSIYGDEDETIDDYTIITPYVLPIASASKLGGIKVGQNLTIDADGTLNAQAEAGDVQSVNGKTGIVILVPSDIGAASSSDLSTLAGTVESQGQAINNIRQVPANGSIGQAVRKTSDGYDWENIREVPENGSTGQAVRKTSDGYGWEDIKEVPAGGTEGQVLTKGQDNAYGWANGGGGAALYGKKMYHNNLGKVNNIKVCIGGRRENVKQLIAYDTFEFNNYTLDVLMLDDWNAISGAFNCKNSSISVFWDDKIIAIQAAGEYSTSSVVGHNFGDVDILTTDRNYINDVIGYVWDYTDTMPATLTHDINDDVEHIMFVCSQYQGLIPSHGYAPHFYYTDAEDVEHEITDLLASKLGGWGNSLYGGACTGTYSLDINDYVKSVRVTATGGRLRYGVYYF